MSDFLARHNFAVEIVISGLGGDEGFAKGRGAFSEVTGLESGFDATSFREGGYHTGLRQLLGKPQHPIQVIGTRHGEKLFETLLTREEMAGAVDQGDYYRIPPDMRDLNYDKYFVAGEERISETPDYNSHNTVRLDVAATRDLLLGLPYIQAMLRGDHSYPEA